MKKGFILKDLLLAMMICLLLLPMTVSCISLFSLSLQNDVSKQDAIAISQLRRILSVSNQIQAQNEYLQFTYHQEEVYLEKVNGNLLLRPGTQFFLLEIDDIYFHHENGCTYMTYERNDNEKTYLLTCS